jgi:hypothetical protein
MTEQEEEPYVVLPKHAYYDLGGYVVAVIKKGLEAYVEDKMGNAGKYMVSTDDPFGFGSEQDWDKARVIMVAKYREVIDWCNTILDETGSVGDETKHTEACKKLGEWLGDNIGWLWD